MNSSKFAEDNATLAYDEEWVRIRALKQISLYVCMTLGIPGNILSAIVWLKVQRKNSSAVYLAALAINDLVYLLIDIDRSFNLSPYWSPMFFFTLLTLWSCAATIEPLLVLSFTVERLLAICWPLRVRLDVVCLVF